MLAFPEVIRFRMPECDHTSGPLDPACNSMHIYGVFLKFWFRYNVGGAVRELLGGRQE